MTCEEGVFSARGEWVFCTLAAECFLRMMRKPFGTVAEVYKSSTLALVGICLVMLIYPLVGSAIVLCVHPHVHVCDYVFTLFENLIEGIRSELDCTPTCSHRLYV